MSPCMRKVTTSNQMLIAADPLIIGSGVVGMATLAADLDTSGIC